ncbi:MAG: sigma factor-like helix-turn-helix DNA-binding protein, partial [Thermocrispum sp.]
LVRVARGDVDAFAEFYDRTACVVFGLAHVILGDAAQSEQVCRQVYLELWRSAARSEPAGADPYTSLIALARRRAIDRVRELDHMPTERREAKGSAGEAADRLLRRLRESAELSSMRATSCEVLVLIFYRGYTLGEVAERLDIPHDTVRARLQEALGCLRATHSADIGGPTTPSADLSGYESLGFPSYRGDIAMKEVSGDGTTEF